MIVMKKRTGFDTMSPYLYPVYICMHPRDGFLELKANKKGSSLVVTIIIGLWLLVEMFHRTSTGYDMNAFTAEDSSLLRTSVITVMIFFMVAISNWCFCTLLDGKGKLKDIYIVICYSLTVLLIGDAVVTFASNFVTTEEVMILTSLQMVCYAYFVFLLIAGLGTVHEYSFAGNLASMVMTIVAAAVILFIGVLLFTMLERMFSFVVSVAEEMMRRLQ